MENIEVVSLASRRDRVVIDVREADEYAGGHAPGAVNIPLRQLRECTADLPSDTTVYVICQSGRRSAQGTEILISEGRNAVNVVGGTTAWIAAGLPVER